MDWKQLLSWPLELKALVLAGVVFGVITFLKLLFRRYKKVSPDDPQFYRVVLSVFAHKTGALFGILLSLYVGVSIFFSAQPWHLGVHRLFFAVCVFQVWIWARYFIELFFERRTLQLSQSDISKATSFRAIAFVANLLLVIVLVLFTLDNFGVNISALVAGLGVGGIAIALAVQSILGDLFASITILLDKPFVVGDMITVGDFSGTIENIGIKTTRVRSVSGEQVIFSNADLLQSRIRNFKRLYERRVVFCFGLTYQTPLDLIEKIPMIVKEIITNTEDLRFERAHFKGFGASSLDFEVVYFVTQSDYTVYMDRQQSVNLAVARRFSTLQVDFAYPTTTFYAPKIEEALVSQAASETRQAPL